VAEAGREVSGPQWQDVVNVPAFGEVTVRVAFDDFAGRSVYHCHILDHEDLGMMGTLEAR
jgi:FtsP/CotA-like multicopper oxidase with cupredoxin domain